MTSLFCIPRRTALCSSAVVIVVAFIVTWRLGVGVVFQPRGISLLVGEEAGKARSVTLRSRKNKGLELCRADLHLTEISTQERHFCDEGASHFAWHSEWMSSRLCVGAPNAYMPRYVTALKKLVFSGYKLV